MLAKLIQKIKGHQSDVALAVFIVFISIISFNLGKISALNQQKPPIKITQPALISNSTNSANEQSVVASKASDSKLYHFLWCSGAERIAEKNKLVFANEAQAVSAGYSLASNCSK